jgi:chorismate mutase
MNKLFQIIILFSITLGFCYAGVNKPLKLLVERAALMQDVGICKFKFKSSIYAAAQEIKVLKNAQSLAKANHLEINSFLTFIQLQMDLSKQIEDYYWRNATQQQLNQQGSDCLTKYRDSIKKIDEQLYPQISKNIEAIKKNKDLALKISELIKKQGIKGIPQDPDYINLLANSLQNLKKT